MKPLEEKYTEHSRTVTEAAKCKAKIALKKSAIAVKAYYKDKLNLLPDKGGIVNVRVIYAGSWLKRGHTSLLAVGAVIEAETGLVMDYETI
ncbi:hypothetical protein SK128_020835, partial [Halocaridina rubra]